MLHLLGKYFFGHIRKAGRLFSPKDEFCIISFRESSLHIKLTYPGSLFLVGISFLLEHFFSRRYLLPPRCYENTHSTASNHRTMAMALLMPLPLFFNLFLIKNIWCSNLPDHFLKVYSSPPFCTEPWPQQNFECYNMFSVSCSIITVAFTYKYWYFLLFSEDNVCIFSTLFL